MPDSFTGQTFNGWTTIIDIEKSENYLKFDEKGRLCMQVRGYMVPFYYVTKRGQTTEECHVSRDQFNDIVISVRRNLIQIAQSLSLEIRERFPRDELLEAMSVVYPHYWNSEKEIDPLKVDFLAKLNTLVHHFGRNAKVEGEEIGGILDSSKLYQQATCFAQTMSGQYRTLPKPIEYGAVIKLWTILGESQYLQENMSEYFKLVDLCQTMILGSVEDERMFSALSFLKSKLRNKLDKNMDTCLRLYVTKYDITNFPFNRALALWRSDCERRGEYNITNVSNELDMEHNVLEAHNDISSTEAHVQNVENEERHENWEFDMPQDII
jgi:hypothetical protein